MLFYVNFTSFLTFFHSDLVLHVHVIIDLMEKLKFTQNLFLYLRRLNLVNILKSVTDQPIISKYLDCARQDQTWCKL